MKEHILLGIIQGIIEWLPVSSEGVLVLVQTHWLNSNQPITTLISKALFLHLGTFLAALLYFKEDVKTLLKTIQDYSSAQKEHKNLLSFLIIATLVSGILGMMLLFGLTLAAEMFAKQAKFVTLIIGILLLGTGLLELKASKGGKKDLKDLKIYDGIVLGIVQGFAALPGFSRSGLTVSALLITQFDKSVALKLSFLMSLPIVLGGNIILNVIGFQWSLEAFIGLLFSFGFGLLTIHGLIKLAHKINFGYFVLLFGFLTILSSLI